MSWKMEDRQRLHQAWRNLKAPYVECLIMALIKDSWRQVDQTVEDLCHHLALR